MFLQGPYFSLPKAKSWWEHCVDKQCSEAWYSRIKKHFDKNEMIFS